MNERTITPDLLRRYVRHLREEERADSTIEKYVRDLEALGRHLAGRPVTKAALIGWKEELAQRHAPATVNSMLAAVNGFLRFMGWRECAVKLLNIQKSPFCDEGRELTRSEYVRLVWAAELDGNRRLALVLQTICATGVRVSELKFITVEAVETGRAEIANKGKRRTVFLPDKLRRLLRTYLQAQKKTAQTADGTYDNSQDENYETNAQHVTYTYDENKTCSYNKKDDEGKYIEGSPYWVKTVTFKGITFNNLVVGSDEIKTLQSVIMNGRRTDTSNQFQASIEVKFENCTFNQTSGTLQVYQIMPCNVTKYSFDECSFNQNATSQYAITLNASETAYKTHISYEITNSHISSKGRGINITAGTEQETLNEVNGTPHIIISNNAFELPKLSDSNMAVQIAGNWSAANLDSAEDALITISDNTIDAYTAVRIHDSMGKNTGDSAKYLVSFSNNTLLNSTQAIVAKTGTNSDENAMLEAIRDAYQSAEDGFITPATSVNLNTTTLSLYSNTEPNTATLTATVLPENTTDEVVWTSSNTNVATVSKAGLVTAVADGTAIITATAGTRESAPSASCTVTVTTYYSGGSSSDDDSDPTYSVTLPKNVKGGEVKTSHRYAEQGNTVTITVDPDKGYELDELTVTDSKGKELDLTDKGNGKYTFKMPGTRVEVEVSFKLIETEPEAPAFADVPASAY